MGVVQRIACLSTVIVVLLSGCQSTGLGSSASSELTTPTAESDRANTPTESPPQITAPPTRESSAEIWAPTATLELWPTFAPQAGLSSTGPWYLFLASTGDSRDTYLWALNIDGTGLIRITQDPTVRFAVRPSDSSEPVVAVITASDMITPVDARLSLITLPSLNTYFERPLIGPEASTLEFMELVPVARAIAETRSLAWSPDGQVLAFIAALEGTSADVYLYEPERSQSITRVTAGETEAADLSWSPDSRYIVHEGVIDFGTGAGSLIGSVWATPVNGDPLNTPLRCAATGRA